MKAYEWALSMRDGVSSIMSKLSSSADKSSAQFSSLQNKIGGFDTRLRATGSTVDYISGKFRQLAGYITGVFSIYAAFSFGRKSVDDFDKQAKADAQLRASLISTRGIAGVTFEKLKDQATALQKITLFGDEDTNKAQSILLTFTKVRGKILNDAIPAIQDLATKLAGDGPVDLIGATKLVGRALDNPIRGLMMLSRSGVAFSNQQIASIKNLVQAGKLQEAQQMILIELNKKFGGSSVAAAEAGKGPWQVMMNLFGEVRESLGGLVMDVLNKYKPRVAGAIEYISNLFVQHSVAITNSLTAIIDTLVEVGDAVVGVIEFLHKHKQAVIALTGAYVAYKGMLTILHELHLFQLWYHGLSAAAIILNTLVTEGYTAAMIALNMAMAANPGVLIVAALAAIAAAVIYCWNNFEGFRGVVMVVWELLKMWWSFLWEIAKNIPLVFIIRQIIEHWDYLKQKISEVWAVVSKFFKGIYDSAMFFIQPVIYIIGKLINWIADLPFMKGVKKVAVEMKQNVIQNVEASYQKGVEDFRADKHIGVPGAIEKLSPQREAENTVYSAEYDNVKKLMEGYKNVNREKALSLAISKEQTKLKEAYDKTITQGMVNGRLTHEAQIQVHHILDAQALLKTNTFKNALLNPEKGKSGILDSLKGNGLATNAGEPDSDMKSGIDKVSGGGSKIVTVNIGKFQDSINIYATTVKEGAVDLTAKIEEALIRAIRGGELAISNE
jgi:hypothetical protein